MKFNQTFLDAVEDRLFIIKRETSRYIESRFRYLLESIRECAFCGDVFLAERGDAAKFCSDKCRMDNYRKPKTDGGES